jgi:hypothetical protein
MRRLISDSLSFKIHTVLIDNNHQIIKLKLHCFVKKWRNAVVISSP